jgi:phospholipid N-methyltransferase
MCEGVLKGSQAINVLEAGSGTGVIASCLLKYSSNVSNLDIVESHVGLFELAKSNILRHSLHSQQTQLGFHCARVEELTLSTEYHAIISSIPLNSLSTEDVMSILQLYKQRLKPGGSISYYEYLGSRMANRMHSLLSDEVYLGNVINDMFLGATVESRVCWFNFPPARVVTIYTE